MRRSVARISSSLGMRAWRSITVKCLPISSGCSTGKSRSPAYSVTFRKSLTVEWWYFSMTGLPMQLPEQTESSKKQRCTLPSSISRSAEMQFSTPSTAR